MIPFRVAVEQEVTEAVRFPQTVFAPEFPVRMLTGVRTSPDGKTVAYSALGKIWVKTLAGRRAAASHRPTATIEFAPSFSPDGQSIVFVDLVRRREWPRPHRARRRIERRAMWSAHLVTTRTVVFARRAVRSSTARCVPTAFAASPTVKRPASSSSRPSAARRRSCATAATIRSSITPATRVYFRDRRDGRFVLASVTRSGGDEDRALPIRERHRRSSRRRTASGSRLPNAGTRLSPPSRAPAGRSISRRAARRFPVNQISRDAGFTLHWSADSRRVQWTMGPELYHPRRDGELSVPRRARRRGCRRPRQPATPIGFTVKADVPTATIALTGARVVTMNGGERLENATVVVEGNRITAVGRERRRFRPARRASTRAARRSCPASSTRTRISAARATGCSPNRAGRCWPISPSA